MGYQRISINALQSLADELDQAYNKVKRKNPQRKSFIALLKELTQTTAGTPDADKIADVLTGAAIFEMEMIKSEYSFRSPENSDLYLLIKNKLNISKNNPLNDDEALVYLQKFNKYAQTLLSDESIKRVRESTADAHWKTKQKLLDDIHSGLKQLRVRDLKRISELVHGTPNLIALQINSQNLRAEYHAKRRQKRWAMFQSSNRETMCDMNDFIHETCNEMYTKNYHYDDTLNNKGTECLQDDEYKTRMGLSLFLLMDIDSEYTLFSAKGGLLNKGSELSKLLLPKFFNVTDIDHLSYDNRIAWLNTLKNHIERIKTNNGYYEELINADKWKKIDLKAQLERMQSLTKVFCEQLQEEKKQPSRTTRVVSTGISYATQCALAYGAKKAVTQGVASGVGSLVAGAVGGPVGFAIYIGGTVVMTGLGALVSNEILSSTAATLYAWMFEKIGDKVAGAAVGVISYPFTASPEGLEQQRRKLSPEDEKLYRELVNTLLELPEDIVSEKEKEKIRNINGIEIGGKLEPLKPLNAEEKTNAARLQKEGFFVRKESNPTVIMDYNPNEKVMIPKSVRH